jgi:hypothetical protein
MEKENLKKRIVKPTNKAPCFSVHKKTKKRLSHLERDSYVHESTT